MSSPAEIPKRPTNRLIHETSPYLLQHAYNPVDWYPWCDAAFDRARQEDKPVFLSVGYSACHWCHVMEHESFENEAIAALMNEHFISVKVDREERPDVDQIYMAAVQLMTQRGGWPMSVFLTPDKQPFYGGTYWPPTSRMGMPGFADILQKLHEIWVHRRDEVTTSAGSLVTAVNRIASSTYTTKPLDEGILWNAMQSLLDSADRHHGGLGGAPKFPHPLDIRVLLRCWNRFRLQQTDPGDTSAATSGPPDLDHVQRAAQADEALDVARLTLDKMARGGIYDHLGGGFHRYSTDERWLVPHFEKMLYDNALLVPAYLEAFQITHDTQYARVATDTLDYVLKEMTSPAGGFFSTQDADSEGEEGKFFVWSKTEIEHLLGAQDARIFCTAYDVTTGGNWEGTNILHRPLLPEKTAAVLGMTVDDLEQTLAHCRAKLRAARSLRVAPGRDEKIIVAWNGWMLSAMALGAAVLGEDRFLQAATAAGDFMLQSMRNEQGRLWHVYKDGEARIPGFLDDYAGLIDGLIDVYQVSGVSRYLVAARELADTMIELFEDPDNGVFFYTPADHEPLITRLKDSQDSATPAGNSLAAAALLKLGRLCGDTQLLDRGIRVLRAVSGLLAEHPRAAGQTLIALDAWLGPSFEIVILPARDEEAAVALVHKLYQRFVPNKVVALGGSRADGDLPPTLNSLFAERSPVGGETTVYVCHDHTCSPPITRAEELWTLLNQPLSG